MEWESELFSIQPPPAFAKIQQLMRGFTSHLLSEIERLPAELSKPFESQDLSTTHTITLEFDVSCDGRIEQLMAETAQLAKIIQAEPDQWE